LSRQFDSSPLLQPVSLLFLRRVPTGPRLSNYLHTSKSQRHKSRLLWTVDRETVTVVTERIIFCRRYWIRILNMFLRESNPCALMLWCHNQNSECSTSISVGISTNRLSYNVLQLNTLLTYRSKSRCIMPEREKLIRSIISKQQSQVSTRVTANRFETIQKSKHGRNIDDRSELRLHMFTFGSRYVYITRRFSRTALKNLTSNSFSITPSIYT